MIETTDDGVTVLEQYILADNPNATRIKYGLSRADIELYINDLGGV